MENTKEMIAYTEVINILNYLEKEYYDKIPKELIEFFKKHSFEYNMCFDGNGDYRISPLAEEILCYLNFEYFCDREEKKILIEKYENNDKKLSEMYDINKVLEAKKNKTRGQKEEDNQVVVVKENLVKKIIDWIKSFFRKFEI